MTGVFLPARRRVSVFTEVGDEDQGFRHTDPSDEGKLFLEMNRRLNDFNTICLAAKPRCI